MIPIMEKEGKGKGLAALIIARKKEKNGDVKEVAIKKPLSEDGIESDNSIGLDSAVDDLIKGLQMKDKAQIKEALKSFVQMCHDESPEEEESEEDEEDLY